MTKLMIAALAAVGLLIGAGAQDASACKGKKGGATAQSQDDGSFKRRGKRRQTADATPIEQGALRQTGAIGTVPAEKGRTPGEAQE